MIFTSGLDLDETVGFLIGCNLFCDFLFAPSTIVSFSISVVDLVLVGDIVSVTFFGRPAFRDEIASNSGGIAVFGSTAPGVNPLRSKRKGSAKGAAGVRMAVFPTISSRT